MPHYWVQVIKSGAKGLSSLQKWLEKIGVFADSYGAMVAKVLMPPFWIL